MNNLKPIRGLMLDPARLTEKHEYYLELIPFLAQWGYNTLWWHFSDDEGFALKLKGHPELASPYALSIDQTRELIKVAADFGITVVPEVESLGHTRSITGIPQYSHLFNGDPIGHNAICPSHPDTLPLLKEIITEVAEIFPSPFLHAGLDESIVGDCPRCREKLGDNPTWRLFAEHAKNIHQIVSNCGKTMIMWADAVEENPELLTELPSDIILSHWHYQEVPEEKIKPSVKAGFKVICVPAISIKMTISPALSFVNVRHMTELAHELGEGCLGVSVCWWESFRVLRDAMIPAMAYAGRAMTRNGKVDEKEFINEFCRAYFEVSAPELAEAIWTVHCLALWSHEMHALFADTPAGLIEALALSRQPEFEPQTEIAIKSAVRLKEARNLVIKNREEFDAIILAADILAGGRENARQLAEAYKAYTETVSLIRCKASPEEVRQSFIPAIRLLENITERVISLAQRTEAEWNRTRFPDDDKKDNSSPRIRQRGQRSLLALLLQAAGFFTSLTRDDRPDARSGFANQIRQYGQGEKKLSLDMNIFSQHIGDLSNHD